MNYGTLLNLARLSNNQYTATIGDQTLLEEVYEPDDR
jgi:hypothetical protein